MQDDLGFVKGMAAVLEGGLDRLSQSMGLDRGELDKKAMAL